MKFNIKYIDNVILLNQNKNISIEIENKQYFYRLINDLNKMANGEIVDDIVFVKDGKEYNYLNKLKIFIDFFNFNLNNRKTLNDIVKYINNNISVESKDKLLKQYNRVIQFYKFILNDIDLPLKISSDLDIEDILKSISIEIKEENSILDNLFVLIDIEKTLNLDNILIFVNLKQYLTKEEIIELYKYSIYNNVILLLIDSQSYGVSLELETKLLIDENLDEFML